jgi:hypothetical protein
MNLFSGPDSEYSNLAESTAAMQLINCNEIEESLKKQALYDISKMEGDVSYSELVTYRKDLQLGVAFVWAKSDKGHEFWQVIFNQLNGL